MIETLLVALLLLLCTPFTSAQWSDYPACSQLCMSNAQLSSGCPLNNVCLCSNTGNFFGKASACALQECDTANFDNTYSTLVSSCNASGQAVDYSLLEFEYAGEELQSTSKSTQSKRTLARNIHDISANISSLVAISTPQPIISATLHLTENSQLTSSTVIISDPAPTPTTSQESKTAINNPSTTTAASHTQAISDPPSTTPTTQEASNSAAAFSLESSSTTPTSSTIPAPTTVDIPAPSTSVSISIPTPSNIPEPNIAICDDPSWAPTPENWEDANVNYELQQRTSQWGNGIKFTDFIGNYTGNKILQCGIGYTSNCNAPDCPSFQAAGGERWVYFVSVSLEEMNTLINIVNDGILAGKDDLSLVITSMANDFFTWQNPETRTQKALPWLEVLISSMLSFIPVFFGAPELGAISAGVSQTAAAFAAGGLQTLAADYSPVTYLLGNMGAIGDLVKNASTTATDTLNTWSSQLFNGEQDAAGNTIVDYMAAGRWTFNYNITPKAIETYYFQSLVSDVVNDQLTTNNDSKTFVMCTSGTSSCRENSFYEENGRSCCLYRIADNGSYIEPPELNFLQNSTYGIQPVSVTASSLHSYEAQGLNYDLSDISLLVNDSLSGNLSNQFFLQGVSSQGIWTLPVCDVGDRGDWVANYSAQMMPCCCGAQNLTGVGCAETIEFFQKAHIAGFGSVNKICATQYPGFVAVSRGMRLEESMVGVVSFCMLVMTLVGFGFDGLFAL